MESQGQNYLRARTVASNPPSVFFKSIASQENKTKNIDAGVNHYNKNFNDVAHLIYK